MQEQNCDFLCVVDYNFKYIIQILNQFQTKNERSSNLAIESDSYLLKFETKKEKKTDTPF
jgi:hypothetical protein